MGYKRTPTDSNTICRSLVFIFGYVLSLLILFVLLRGGSGRVRGIGGGCWGCGLFLGHTVDHCIGCDGEHEHYHCNRKRRIDAVERGADYLKQHGENIVCAERLCEHREQANYQPDGRIYADYPEPERLAELERHDERGYDEHRVARGGEYLGGVGQCLEQLGDELDYLPYVWRSEQQPAHDVKRQSDIFILIAHCE